MFRKILSITLVICLCLSVFAVMPVQAASKPRSSNFMTGVIDPFWKIVNENPATYSVEAGLGLRLPTQVYDIYESGSGWENIFIQEAEGDWEVISKVYYPVIPSANYQQQALLVWQDADNYIKIDVEYTTWNGPIKAQMIYESGGTVTNVYSEVVEVPSGATSLTVYYKYVRQGNTYTGYYSLDGQQFRQLGTVTLALQNVHIGVTATKNTSLDESPMIDTYCQYIQVITDEPYPFTIEADALEATVGGIKASARVIPTEGVPTHDGNEVVLFQLMKGDTPIGIMATEWDITEGEKFTAFFNVDPSDDSYVVNVFVLDSFSDLTYAPVPLAEKVTIK
ncbi:MAG: DUF1349 domain-containing protein [Clostridiaceae bacterium]|nr:DUF1349 domain-containing protein [Clostridiaceae bacterium]